MQRSKDIKSFSEIDEYCKNDSYLLDTSNKLLNGFDLRYIDSFFSKLKKQGVDAKIVFRSLFLLRFINFDNVHQLMLSGLSKELTHKKDVFYDFLNNPKINWRNILWLFSKQALKITVNKSIDEESKEPKCLIVDDSILPKTGKTIELIGKVYDHGKHIYSLGMKILTIGYSDGKSFTPLDFSIHNESGKNNKRGLKPKELKKQFNKERAKETSGYKRQMELSESKIDVALSMLKRLLKKSIKVDYILADSWFITEKFITSIKEFKKTVNIVGLMKINRIIVVDDKKYKADTVADIFRKNTTYCKKLKCYYIKKKVNYKGIELMAFWVRMEGQQSWKLLVTTDLKLSFIKAMKTYQTRWSIEVFFKDCKQSLKLNSCQSKDFDAHIATISLVFMNYTLLSMKRRFEDYETLGQLFKKCKDLILEETLIQRIWQLFQNIFASLFSKMGVDWEYLIALIIENKDAFIKECNKNFETLFAFDART